MADERFLSIDANRPMGSGRLCCAGQGLTILQHLTPIGSTKTFQN